MNRIALIALMAAGCAAPQREAGPELYTLRHIDLVEPPAPEPEVAAQGARVATAEEAASRFGYALYDAARTAEGDLTIAPWSAWVALSMAAVGADAGAASAMATLLRTEGLPDAPGDAGRLARRLQDDAAAAAITWSDANRAYVDARARSTLLPEFVVQLEASFGAQLGLAPFRSDPDGARRDINAWIAGQTRERIPELLGPGAIDTTTRLVLVNAVYFLADWLEPFPPDATTDQPFHLLDGTQVDVPAMALATDLRASEAEGVVAVALPYEGGRFEAVVVVPPHGGISRAEELLAEGALGAGGALDSMGTREVHLWLPRFEQRTNGSLLGALYALGLPRGLPFAQMLREEALELGDVIQEAFIKTDEIGTEAAAATAVIMRATSAMIDPEPPLIVRADRPFLFVVRHAATRVPVFIARVADPT